MLFLIILMDSSDNDEDTTMRMLDMDQKVSLKNVAMFLTVEEAEWLKRELEGLLKQPEAYDHLHVCSLDNAGRELSCSLVTSKKMKTLSRYTKAEQDALKER